MKKNTSGDARPEKMYRTRVPNSDYKARVLYFLRFKSIHNIKKPVLSTPKQLESKFALLSVVIPLGVLSFAFLVTASTVQEVTASSFSEGINSSEKFVEGSLVSLITTEPASVELADINTSNYLAGVVESSGSGLVVADVEGSNVYVATSGITSAFISDLNGEIKAGDFIGASWIRGVGMKIFEAADNDQKILGVALQDLNTEDEFSYEVKDVKTIDGTKTARIGKISMKIFPRDIGPYFAANDKSGLEEFASNLAGREVPFVRIVAALLLFSIAVVISGVFMTNAIRGGLTSLGRNPLASDSIFTTLTQISAVSVGLIIVGAAIAYGVLII